MGSDRRDDAEKHRGDERPRIAWAPVSPSQRLFLSCPHFECLLEGTRGSLKTDALLMDFAQHVGQGHGYWWRGVLFRREFKDLADLVSRSKRWFRQIFPQARFLESHSDYKWVWPDGEELLLRAAKKADDYWNYHGQEYPWIGWEELVSWPNLDLYDAMKTCCRSSNPRVPRKYRGSCNPWGPGHNVVKLRFIDPAPAGQAILDEAGRPRVRIHASIDETDFMKRVDPDYVKTLDAIRDPNKRKAWRHGSWDIVAGGMFDDVWDPSVHVLEPFEIPVGWYVDRSFDWGSSKPFSTGWWAESDGTDAVMADGSIRSFPPGTLFRIGEWYGWNGNPNEGLRMIDSEIGRGILKRESDIRSLLAAPEDSGRMISPGPADSSIFDETNADSIALEHERVGVRWEKADKSPGSRITGWEVVRRRLLAALPLAEGLPMEEPGLFVFSTCRQFIRTVPVLPRKASNPDDVDTETEDHIGDEVRYRVLHERQSVGSVEMRL